MIFLIVNKIINLCCFLLLILALKNAYVDVFNPSGAPVNKAAENILAPDLPPAAVPQGGYFVPGSGPTGGSSSQDNNGYQQQQQQPQDVRNYSVI